MTAIHRTDDEVNKIFILGQEEFYAIPLSIDSPLVKYFQWSLH